MMRKRYFEAEDTILFKPNGHLQAPRALADLGHVPDLGNGPLLHRLTKLTNPSDYDTTYLTHGIHPYAAKYIPQIPRLIISEHTNERHTILDPFCGSGTTLLEASLLGRKSVGVDSHSIATLIASAKTTPLSESALAAIGRLFDSLEDVASARRLKKWLPSLAGLKHWFAPCVITELCWLRSLVENVSDADARIFLKCILSSIIVLVSNQESETRYAAIDKGISPGETVRKFRKKLMKELPNIALLSSIDNVARNRPLIRNCSIANKRATGLNENSVDLVVTSPPYPNSYDYYLYHKWRMAWLGFDHYAVQDDEIGSRHEHSSKRQPADVYVKRMRPAIAEIARVLKPRKLGYFFVGDAVINGQLIAIDALFDEIIKGSGLHLVDSAAYDLNKVSRSFREKTSNGCHGGAKHPEKRQRVLVVEKRNSKSVSIDFDIRKQARPSTTLPASNITAVKDRQLVSLISDEADRHIHSLGRYPSRFIPNIPRWAIEAFSEPGNLVLDPFVGSGTSAVESALAGRNFLGADISPYACLLTRAKTVKFSEREIERLERTFMLVLDNPSRLPKSNGLEFPLADFWFDRKHLAQIESLRRFITRTYEKRQADFLLAVLATAIRACSYQDEGQIKVKRDPRKVLKGTASPIDLLRLQTPKHFQRLREFNMRRGKSNVRVQNRSAARLSCQDEAADLIVTSPPYINAINYPMTHRYENLLLRLIDSDAQHDHQTKYFGTERVYAEEYDDLHLLRGQFGKAQELDEALLTIYRRERKRSFIAYKFFQSMRETFLHLNDLLRPSGKFVLVAGRNQIKGVTIDTFGILLSMLQSMGYERTLQFDYEIIKNALKITRHATADIIRFDGVAVLTKR